MQRGVRHFSVERGRDGYRVSLRWDRGMHQYSESTAKWSRWREEEWQTPWRLRGESVLGIELRKRGWSVWCLDITWKARIQSTLPLLHPLHTHIAPSNSPSTAHIPSLHLQNSVTHSYLFSSSSSSSSSSLSSFHVNYTPPSSFTYTSTTSRREGREEEGGREEGRKKRRRGGGIWMSGCGEDERMLSYSTAPPLLLLLLSFLPSFLPPSSSTPPLLLLFFYFYFECLF